MAGIYILFQLLQPMEKTGKRSNKWLELDQDLKFDLMRRNSSTNYLNSKLKRRHKIRIDIFCNHIKVMKSNKAKTLSFGTLDIKMAQIRLQFKL